MLLDRSSGTVYKCVPVEPTIISHLVAFITAFEAILLIVCIYDK